MTIPQSIEEANALLQQNREPQSIEEANALLQQPKEPQSIEEANAQLQPQKKSLGIGGTLKTQTEAKAGRKVGAVEAIAENTPIIGQVMDAEYNRQWNNLRRLYEGDFKNGIEASELATALGYPEDDIRRINEEAGTGPRTLMGNRSGFDLEKGKALFKELVQAKFAERLKARQEAEKALQNNDLAWYEKAVTGGVGAGKALGSMASVPISAATLGVDMMNRAASLKEGNYGVDDEGNITKAVKVDAEGNPILDANGNTIPVDDISGNEAMLKGLAGAGAERAVWMLLGPAAKAGGGKLLQKFPGLDKALGGAASGAVKNWRAVNEFLGETAAGRAVQNIGKVIGWVNSKGKFGSIPEMMVKSRLQELGDEVIGLSVKDPADRESFGKWLGKWISLKDNAELFTELLGVHLAMKAGGAVLKTGGRITGLSQGFNRKSATGQAVEREIAQYIGEERARKLKDEDLINLYRLVHSRGFTAEKAEKFASDLAADMEAAEKKVAEGGSLTDVIEGLKARSRIGETNVDAAKTLATEMRDRITLDDAQQEKVYDKALEYAEGNEAFAAQIRDAALAKLTNKHTQVDDSDGLDGLMADVARKFDPELRKVKIHDLRGNESVSDQIAGIEGLGITSWEQAEQEGLVTKDKYGNYGGGARQALNILIHGTDKLKAGVKDGTISGETAERILTSAQCELGARPIEEQRALVDGIIDRANGDEALARRMVEKLEAEDASSAARTSGLDARLDRVAQEAKEDALRERHPEASEETIRGASVEPVETPDGKISTLGDVAGAEKTLPDERKTSAARNVIDAIRNGIAGKTGFGILRRSDNTEIRFELGRSGMKGVGAMHIVENRMLKDGATLDEAAEIALKVGEAAILGEETMRRYNTVHYDYNGVRAIVAEMPDGSKIITGYEINTDAESGANRRPNSLRTSPHVSSEEVVAALQRAANSMQSTLESIAQSAAAVNTPKPTTAIGGAENADRLAGTKLTVHNGVTMGCERFPEAKVRISSNGISVSGIADSVASNPENTADFAAFMTHLMRIATKNGVGIKFDDPAVTEIAKAVITEIREKGAEKTMNRMNTRSKLFGLLFRAGLGNGVTYDEASFRDALAKTSNGRRFVDNHGNIYGFKDGEGVLHFNPTALNFNTPIHEYGHLALETIKSVNRKLWDKGMELIRKSDYYRDIEKLANTEGHEYSYLKGDTEGICDEALATLIGDQGEKLIESRGVDSQLKQWLKDVWKAFKGAIGVADLTEEQVSKMTLDDFVNTVNSELLSGREFGRRKARPLEKKSIKKYDEEQDSGSNGLLRWKNDRGFVFAIPVDMERTQPGGRVVFATDDANITDWIQSRLNGFKLRLSKKGKIYVEGRDGLPPELAEIFGRYPTIGENDGLFGQIAEKLQNPALKDLTPDKLVEALAADRANYDAWLERRDKAADYYAEQAEREEFEARERWEQNGFNAIDYIQSRVEAGDPEFDLDWETAREIENDRAMGRFSAKRVDGQTKFSIAPEAKQVSDTTRKEFADDPVTSKWKIRVEPEAFRQLEPRPLETIKPITDKADNKTVKRAVEQLFVGFGKVHNADDGTDVVFNRNDAGKIMMQSGIDMRTFAPQLKHLFETATLAFEGPQNAFPGHKFRPNVDWFKNYVNKFVGLDGKGKYIRFTVRIENNWTKQGVHAATVSDVAIYENENAEGVSFRAHKLRGSFRGFTDFILSHYIGKGKGVGTDVRFSVGNENAARGGAAEFADFDPNLIGYDPNIKAMGRMEQNAGGLAGAIEKREALRPWTKANSPAATAKPIAFDAADMIDFWRQVSGSMRNPHVQKGDRIAGHRNAIGLNIGGTAIEIVSKLFGVIDESDVAKLRNECRADGFFRNENPDWCATQTSEQVALEEQRSAGELDRRTQQLYRHRVKTGEGGEHYATQVLGHEIGHTLGALAEGGNLGPVGNALRTLYKSMTDELRRRENRPGKDGTPGLRQEIEQLIAWWHGTETCPKYYEKPKERFAELFGIFLTQPESVHRQAPRAYDACVDIIGKNPVLALAYRRVCELKWSGKSNDRVRSQVRKTWTKEAEKQYAELVKLSKESISKDRDWFNYALNDRFGPMFAISRRSIKAERKQLEKAVREGAMSEKEMQDRLAEREREVNALKTSLYDWQRQSGGATRLMIAGFDDVMRQAEKDGVNWNDLRDYAHYMRVIELGGRATAFGVDPARASAVLGDMARKLGTDVWTKIEKTWKAYRAVYEREVLEDPNVRELFDDVTNKMLFENKHYVTMRHRMGVEEAADWQKKIEEYRKGNSDAWDPCIDIQQRLRKGLGSGGDLEQGFVLYRLTGSFEATEDPIAATMKRAIEIKESAARNHLVKQLSATLRECNVKGVFDTALEKNGRGQHKVDPSVYGKLVYLDNGVRHELIVPKVIYKGFKGDSMSFGAFGATMRFLRNTMTLWNPAFINRAYLIDKSSLETNLKGLHKPVVDAISEALCVHGIGVPLYLVNNYLTRFTPVAKTWIGKILWNENTVNHYAYRAMKIARLVYEGRFSDRLAEAQDLRANGLTAEATEIEENVAIAKEMLKKNVFQSAYEFNVRQAGLGADDILQQFGYRIEGNDAKTFRAKAWEKAKASGRWWNRFEEEQEACTKIIAYLYRMKQDAKEGRTGKEAEDARARLVIEQGGTPNLAARGVMASYIENATGFFWNVRKEGTLRTWRALKDHPTEWLTKNMSQTALPALLKGLIITGGAQVLIRSLFDDDEEKIKNSWWAPAVLEHCKFVSDAMKCVPGYYQRNYNVIPLAKFGDEVVSLRVKYSPEEFAIQNAIHTAFQMLGKDPTDPDADWSTLTEGVWNEMFPNIFGRNYALDAVGTLVGPLVGINPYDQYRQRKVYDETTWKVGWSAPGHMAKEMAKNFWNYSPLGTFTATFKNGQERKLEDSDVPAWLDMVLATPFVRMIPASMLTITSKDAYNKALVNLDEKQKANARLVARDVLAGCIERGALGGFEDGLKDLAPELRPVAIRHVLNGWRQYHADPTAKAMKRAKSIKDPNLRKKAMQWILDGEKYQD